MAKKVQKEKGKKSFVLSAVDAFSAFIYSLFSCGRVGTAISSECGPFQSSFFKRTRNGIKNNYTDMIMEQSRLLRFFGIFKDVLASLALNVYGIFFVVYGLVSISMYFTAYIVNGMIGGDISALILSAICVICAIPMLVSSDSVASVVSESKITKKIVISLLAIPEEKLRFDKHIYGTEYMFMSAIIAVLFGVFTYFIHPAYALYIVGAVLAICIVSTNPETGVVLSILAAPFLQYNQYKEVILLFLILLTAISYIVKVARRRRSFDLSSESILVLIFCGFILAASSFARGGWITFFNSLYAVTIILGGFFLPYNLIRNRQRLSTCVKVLTTSLVVLSCFGLWDVFYNGIADGVVYSISENIRPIFDINIVYIADNAAVFGMFAVLVIPLIFAGMTRKNSISGFLSVLILIGIVVWSVFIYGSYEAVIAIALEFCVFWLLYSHRSVTTVIISSVVILIAAIMYPYLSAHFGWTDLGHIIRNSLPLGFENAESQTGVTQSVIEMLKDGNWLGIGVGREAFELAHKPYATAVSAGATDPSSFWLQIVCWSGIGGLIVFALFMAVLIIKGLGYILVSKEKKLRGDTIALICGIFMALIFGLVNCIWSDVRMFFLFWICAGLLAGYIREGKDIENKKIALFADSEDNTDIAMKFNR